MGKDSKVQNGSKEQTGRGKIKKKYRQGHACLSLVSVVCCKIGRRADRFSRGVLPSVVCLSVIVKPRQRGDPGALGAVAPL
jgi:hypothetical protein